MKTLKLTNSDNKNILVNFQNVSHVVPTDKGSVIYTVRESGYYSGAVCPYGYPLRAAR